MKISLASCLAGAALVLVGCSQGGAPGLSLSQGTLLSVQAGGSGQEDLSLSAPNGTVQLSYQVSQGGQSGSGFSFSPSSVAVSSSPSDLKVQVSPAAQVASGSYQVQVTAREGGVSGQAGFPVQVSSALSLSGAAALSVQQGSSGKETLSLSSPSLSGTVQLSYRVSEGGAALPSSAFSFSPSSVTLSAGKAVQVPLTVKTPSSLAGHDQVQVTASLSGASASATFPLTVTGEQVIYSFQGGSDGANPRASLIFGSNGELYGTTYGGGTSNGGTVFQLAPATTGSGWTETVLHNFGSGSDGDLPFASLILGSNGDLYGTTYGGGTSNGGTVFQLSPPISFGGSWTEAVLHNFGSGSDGGLPYASLIFGSNRELYGTTYGGGTSSVGTVFKIVL